METPPPEDLVWHEITNSAKGKFDYNAFKEGFGDFGNNNLPQNVLLLTIVGHAAAHSTEQIVADINQELALIGLGYSKDDLPRFVSEIKTKLEVEIHAADVALALFERGTKTPGVLVQVRSMLGS